MMDDRERRITDLQHYLDGWRRRWHGLHKRQLLRASWTFCKRDCPKAGVIDMHGKLIYGCNMGFCIIMDFSGGMK